MFPRPALELMAVLRGARHLPITVLLFFLRHSSNPSPNKPWRDLALIPFFSTAFLLPLIGSFFFPAAAPEFAVIRGRLSCMMVFPLAPFFSSDSCFFFYGARRPDFFLCQRRIGYRPPSFSHFFFLDFTLLFFLLPLSVPVFWCFFFITWSSIKSSFFLLRFRSL